MMNFKGLPAPSLDRYRLNLDKGTQEIFYNDRKGSYGKGSRRIDGYLTFCSRKCAKKNNEMNLLKNLCVFAPLREIFSVAVYPDLGRHSARESNCQMLIANL